MAKSKTAKKPRNPFASIEDAIEAIGRKHEPRQEPMEKAG